MILNEQEKKAADNIDRMTRMSIAQIAKINSDTALIMGKIMNHLSSKICELIIRCDTIEEVRELVRSLDEVHSSLQENRKPEVKVWSTDFIPSGEEE